MKWIAVIPLVVLNLFLSLPSSMAQISDGADKKTQTDSARVETEIATAIDIIDLWNRGLGDAEVSTLLSGQLGFDRDGALKKGDSDEQIIADLITTEKNARVPADVSRLGQHKIEGDRYYKEAQFDKAAREYTLAIAFASNNYEPYKLRADTYKQYLKTKLNPAAKDNPDKMKQDVLDKSRTLLCRAIHADYEKAASITTKTLADINGDINLIKDKMQKGITDYDPESKVYPYYIKSSDRTLDARRMRGLYNAHRTVTQAAMNINKAMTDSKAVCETKQTGQP